MSFEIHLHSLLRCFCRVKAVRAETFATGNGVTLPLYLEVAFLGTDADVCYRSSSNEFILEIYSASTITNWTCSWLSHKLRIRSLRFRRLNSRNSTYSILFLYDFRQESFLLFNSPYSLTAFVILITDIILFYFYSRSTITLLHGNTFNWR